MFIRYPQLRAKGVPWSRTHITRLERLGQFPQSIRLGEATVVWIEAEIDAFMASKFAQRGKAAGSTEVELLTAA
ncbi:MAG: AlpA family phage regulatory protein [Rhodopila sp.]|jgi:prophage regulatory protein